MSIYTKATTMVEFMNIVDKLNDQLEDPTTLGDAVDTFDDIIGDFFGELYDGRTLGVQQYERTNRYDIRIDVSVWVADNDEDKAHTLIMTYELYLKRDTLEIDTLGYRETKHYNSNECKWTEMSIDFDEDTFKVNEYQYKDY